MMVESHQTVNLAHRNSVGSNPTTLTSNANVAEQVDAPDLESGT